MLLNLFKTNKIQSVDSRQLYYDFINVKELFGDGHLNLRFIVAKLYMLPVSLVIRTT